MKLQRSIAGAWCHRINAVVLAGLAIWFFLLPGVITIGNVRDPALREPGIPQAAWRLHRYLTPRYARWARKRIASGRAGELELYNVPDTEWPMFGSVFYLWATEALQIAWEHDPSLSKEAPVAYARDTLEACMELITDPVHHTWVRQHWGEDYLYDRNVFFRSLLLGGMTSYMQMTSNPRYEREMTLQVDSLRTALAESPHGVLEDYPQECYPIDVFCALAVMKRAAKCTGQDISGFLQQARRGFTGSMLDSRGLVPYLVEEQSGLQLQTSRGIGNSHVLIFAPELYPDLAEQWYERYLENFWQDHGWAAGFREFPKDLGAAYDWTQDVDAGPILAGFSPSGNAFGVAATRINGRFDHAYTLGAQVIAAGWPLPGGALLGGKILSDQVDAPYLGETALLFMFTANPAEGIPVVRGGRRTPLVAIGLLFYFGVGGVLLLASVLRWRRAVRRGGVATPAQIAVWGIMWLGVAAALLLGRLGWALACSFLALGTPAAWIPGWMQPGKMKQS